MTTEEQPKEKKILLFNASALKYTVCDRYFFRSVLQGYSTDTLYNDTHFGTCYHLFQKEFALTKGLNYPTALKKARELWRVPKLEIKSKKEYINEAFLCVTLANWYSTQYELDDCKTIEIDNVPIVEQKLHIPYYSDDVIDVILTGTLDAIVKIENGCFAIRDFKTTSSWKKDEFLDNYRMSPQLKFYLYLLQKQMELYPDSVVTQMLQGKKIGAFIDGVFLSGASKDAEFKRSQVMFFTDEQMLEFESLLRLEIDKAIFTFRVFTGDGQPPRKNGQMTGACHNIYGNRCAMFDACAAPNAIVENHILKNNFTIKEWGFDMYGGED